MSPLVDLLSGQPFMVLVAAAKYLPFVDRTYGCFRLMSVLLQLACMYSRTCSRKMPELLVVETLCVTGLGQP